MISTSFAGSYIYKKPRFKLALTRCPIALTTMFDEAWGIESMASEYLELTEFAGGLGSIFPNTASVQSDFSLLKREKDHLGH